MLKAIAQQGERNRWGREELLDLAGLAAALIITVLLLQDSRTLPAERVAIVGASAAALLPLGVRAFAMPQRARVARTAAALLVGACATATYRIGGLGYLVAVLFFLLAATLDVIPERPRGALGGATRVIAGLIAIPSLFDPAVGLLVGPIFLALFLWWTWTRPNAWSRFAFGFLAGVMAVGVGLGGLFLAAHGHALFLVQPVPLLLLAIVLVARRRGWLGVPAELPPVGAAWPQGVAGLCGGVLSLSLLILVIGS